LKADSRFHIEIAVASRSERLVRREVALQAESVGMLWLPHLPGADVGAALAEHRAIADAIRTEDGPSAAAAAETHIRANLRRLVAAHLDALDADLAAGEGSR
jgi:DNA-binding GntR family transcriptional regulator